jgi:hypothetical protein
MTVDVGPTKYKVWIFRVYMLGILVAAGVAVIGALIR